MKLLFDFLPLILFFGSYRTALNHPAEAHQFMQSLLGGQITEAQAPILLATVIIMVVTVAQIILLKIFKKPVEKMLWFSLVLVVLAGGATLLFHNPEFIMWKPSILYWAFSVGLLASQWFAGKNLIREILDQHLELPEPLWLRLNFIWALFFAFLGGLNLWVAFNFSERSWVNFKTFGMLGVLIIFVAGQLLILSRRLKEKEVP